MADKVLAFERFADEVRTSAGFLNSRFKAIRMSTDEARRCRSQIKSDAAENGETVPAIPLRPETPGNIRGLYRGAKQEVMRLREAFSCIEQDSVKHGDFEQVDGVIKQLEGQLNLITNNIEKLKSNRPKTSRPKSEHRKKSARQSSKRVLPRDSPRENEAPRKEVLKETFTGTKRHISMPPVVSTKVKKPFSSRNANSTVERKCRSSNNSASEPKKRVWGAFHGHKTLSKEKSEIVPLPPAPDTRSLVSSGSHDSESDRTHFNFSHAPTNPPSPRLIREKTTFKPIGKPAAKLNIPTREVTFNFPGRTGYTRQDAFTAVKKVTREFTNLETVDLNSQVDGTIRSSPPNRFYNNLGENPGSGDLRKPPYLVSRSKSIPDANLEKRISVKKPTIGYPFGSSFPELPPLASLKRGFYQTNKSPTK